MACGSCSTTAPTPTSTPGKATKYRALLLFGGPGTGKGTQGKVLGAVPGFQHCATGDIFRALDKQSELGKLFLSYSTKGLLVPDDVTVRIWADAMKTRIANKTFDPASTILVLDGIPRTLEQAKFMADHIDVLKVIHLTTDDRAAMVERMKKRALKEGRPDDADEAVIRRRWEVYDAETKPVLAQYPAGLIANINAVGTPARVLRDVLNVVVPLTE